MLTADTIKQEAEQRTQKVRARARVRSGYVALEWLYWPSVPTLALLAYCTNLRVGFLLDDWGLLKAARDSGLNLGELLPKVTDTSWSVFFRPVGTFLTWQVGWQLWGANPLPYHLMSLVLHACVALLVVLVTLELTGRRDIAWIAGALFGVFPLHLEAVAWLAAQWDVLATLFCLSSLLLFVRWWKQPATRKWLYAGAFLLYALALLTKESAFTFFVVYGLAVLLVGGWRRYWGPMRYLALVPFVLLPVVYAALRIALWGRLGGYASQRSDYQYFVWEHTQYDLLALLGPFNPAAVGVPIAQVGTLVSFVLLISGLILFGHNQRRLLFFAGGWLAVALVPALSYRVSLLDLHNNRYLYLAAVGYCMGVACLVAELRQVARKADSGRPIRAYAANLFVGALLVCFAALSWVQLRPWHTATVHADALERRLLALIPPEPQAGKLIWYTQELPQLYQGAYSVGYFLGASRNFMEVDGSPAAAPNVIPLEGGRDRLENLGSEMNDAFWLRFGEIDPSTGFRIDKMAGITGGEADLANASSEATSISRVWDFRTCSEDVLRSWVVEGASAQCLPSKGLVVSTSGSDTQLVARGIDFRVAGPAADGDFVRLRAAVDYPKYPEQQQQWAVLQWSWAAQGQDPAPESRAFMPLNIQPGAHVYWNFIPAHALKDGISTLRLAPADIPNEAHIKWLALDQPESQDDLP